jgi:hypothetical protein
MTPHVSCEADWFSKKPTLTAPARAASDYAKNPLGENSMNRLSETSLPVNPQALKTKGAVHRVSHELTPKFQNCINAILNGHHKKPATDTQMLRLGTVMGKAFKLLPRVSYVSLQLPGRHFLRHIHARIGNEDQTLSALVDLSRKIRPVIGCTSCADKIMDAASYRGRVANSVLTVHQGHLYCHSKNLIQAVRRKRFRQQQ